MCVQKMFTLDRFHCRMNLWTGHLLDVEPTATAVIAFFCAKSVTYRIYFVIGMAPLFVWLGNPCCFPCIPLRILVVLPAGVISAVMTFSPAMGLANYRLVQYSPQAFRATIQGTVNTLFMLGMVFWALCFVFFLVGFCCWHQFCREKKIPGEVNEGMIRSWKATQTIMQVSCDSSIVEKITLKYSLPQDDF